MTDDILEELDNWIEIIEKSQGSATLVLLSADTHKRAADTIKKLRDAGNKLIEVMQSGSDSAWDDAIDDWHALLDHQEDSNDSRKYLKEKLARITNERDKLREKILNMSEEWRTEVADLHYELNRVSRTAETKVDNWREIAGLINSDNVDERNLGYELYDAEMKMGDKHTSGDIVERLRDVGFCGVKTQQEAADEIERLREMVDTFHKLAKHFYEQVARSE